ncbi:unnamed protein product, partial [Didymodactylos carnosus]
MSSAIAMGIQDILAIAPRYAGFNSDHAAPEELTWRSRREYKISSRSRSDFYKLIFSRKVKGTDRPRAQWYWKSSYDPWTRSGKEEWTKYSDIESEIIEEAFNGK